jgi:alpha-ketoglutarate-dependent taurine dioxygenase
MKTRSLKNYSASVGVEAYDIDWTCGEEVCELGKLCASECIVLVDEKVPTETLHNTMMEWGDASRAFIHNAVISKKLQGRHWREILLNLGFINRDIDEKFKGSVSMVSYKRDEKNRPKGIFQNGELNWHSDQYAFDDGQRIIGLCSVSDTENSQTEFLCTHDAYESLSSEMQSMVKELVVKHKWIDGAVAPGLNHSQTLLIHYNSVPIDGMETKLYRESCTGLSGMKLPVASFDGFVGMSMEESNKVMDEINKTLYKDEYIYTQNWKDGQLMFMDQEITLHRRPTNIEDGNKRTLMRVISYLNKLFDNEQSKILDKIRYNGDYYDQDEFLALVDKDRKRRFLLEETSVH